MEGNRGPEDCSVLYLQATHISSVVSAENVDTILRVNIASHMSDRFEYHDLFMELVEVVQKKLNIDPTKFTIKLSTKYSFMEKSSWNEVQVSIIDNDALKFIMGCPKMQMLHLYVEAEPSSHHVDFDGPESYIPRVTEGLCNIGFNDQAESSTYRDFDEHVSYIPQVTDRLTDFGYRDFEQSSGSWDQYIVAPSNEDPTCWPNSAPMNNMGIDGLEHTTILASSERREISDVMGDSHRDVCMSDSEPEISSGDSEKHDNDEDEMHDDDVENMHAYRDEGMSSREPPRDTTQRRDALFLPSMPEMPPFFNAVYDEQVPDSIGAPSGSRTSYYNPVRGELSVNMVFKDKKDLIASVKGYSVRVARREYRVADSMRILWKVQCKNNSPATCPWGLRASFKSKMGYWKLTRYGGPHTCISTSVGVDHHNLDTDMVANTLLGIVRCDPSFEIKYIKENVKDKYEYKISYMKVWTSLQRAVDNVYGTWESSVRLLPSYMGALCKYNPGTITEWKYLRANNRTLRTLNYVFWAFRPCIDGFRHCRRVISVDDTHLYTKYKHKMLIAVTLDGNNQIIPLAFAIVDEETHDSWKWFLKNLGRHVICGASGVCLISDRHKGIIRAVEEPPYFQPPYVCIVFV